MRIKLTLNRTNKQRMLPMDYQYYISAWIYNVLYKADQEFATFLHEQGYGNSQTKLYKLFCFSQLNFGKPTLWKEQKLFEINQAEITLKVSFDAPEIASNFVKGLFMEQEFYLGNRFNGIDFKVLRVETLPEPVFTETMCYSLQTPWVVSYKDQERNSPVYLTPEHDMHHSLSVKHIVEKYKNTRNTTISAEELTLTINNNYKRSGFRLKPGTNEETRVVGNLFDFELNAPIEVHKMIWNAGVSEKSSSGFGWMEENNDSNGRI
jgi:CRISPR-associated endoribonuclease Cas6